MYINVNDGNMYYNIYNSGKPLILLHGWGNSSLSFNNIIAKFTNNKVYVIDFLGFGLSEEAKKPLTLDDYSSHINIFIEELNIQDPIICAHSFGGRVAINYLIKYDKEYKLILIDSAGIKPKRNFKYYFQIYRYKLLKKYYYLFNKKKYFELINNSGSVDYKRSSKIMKQTMSIIINTNQLKDLPKIRSKTLLIWGIHDKQTNFSDGQIMNEKIILSTLIPFYKSSHFPFITEEDKFISVVKRFIEDDD